MRIIVLTTALTCCLGFFIKAQDTEPVHDQNSSNLIYVEKDGIVAIEAEDFYKQTSSGKRKWYITSKDKSPAVTPDKDNNHSEGASNHAYIEILPDTRSTHEDILMKGENFSDQPGVLGIVHYKVKFNTTGRFYVWVRAFSTGSEDNGIHVGINDDWPEHGQRMQWCEGKNDWTWESRQRTKEVHCGLAHQIYLDIDQPGIHDIQFSMREDGFEFDKFILTRDIHYRPEGNGPDSVNYWKNPSLRVEEKVSKRSYISQLATSSADTKTFFAKELPVQAQGFYKDTLGDWLAINPEHGKEAQVSMPFYFSSGRYDILFVGVGENDGQSNYVLTVNDRVLGGFTPPLAKEVFEQGPDYNQLFENISLSKGDVITLKAKLGSADGQEWARGRWSGIVFVPAGKGMTLQNMFPGKHKISEPVKVAPPAGRLAIVADGNSPDPDDLGGTAVSLALVRATLLNDRLVHYSHSCDLVRSNRISEQAEIERHALMQTACDVTARRWGGFDHLKFYDALWEQEESVNSLTKAINESSKNNPLWIVEAGEPDIIGFALEASQKNKRQFVKVITHHSANDDAGDYYTWQQILDFGVEEVRIPDQNVFLKVDLELWDWAKNHSDPRVQWVWLMGKIAEVDDVVKFQKGKWDCSDAGMVLYWISGATSGGLELGSIEDVKKLLLDYID
ncbi:hypothetical protein [Echinicola sp. 20G]|uniref:hypothetical protein n=1 Tax=Echinicola sp. 20G TaxID=2781961 RepID=UPI00190FD15A|nr:hypothetical protein [Echinicola sp. 20G]